MSKTTICAEYKHLDKGENSTYSVHWRCTPMPENICYITGRRVSLSPHTLNKDGDCKFFERTPGPVTASEVLANSDPLVGIRVMHAEFNARIDENYRDIERLFSAQRDVFQDMKKMRDDIYKYKSQLPL